MRLSAVLVAALSIGCELIAPLDDVRRDPADAASAGQSGAGGDAGSTSGGAAGTGGAAGGGMGGGAGQSGSAGSAGSAGAGGSSGASPVLLASGQSGPEHPALDATHLYWTNDGSVARVPKNGGNVETLVTVGVNNEVVAVDDQSIYFSDRLGHTIRRAPKTGGSSTLLAQNQSFPQGLGIDATHVYWASEGDGAIRRVPKTGGTVETLAATEPAAYALVVDGGEALWTLSTGQVRKLSIASCCAVTELSPSVGGGALSLAVDATHAYWASQSSGTLRRVPRSGGASEEIGFAPLPDGIAVDATNVYIGEDANPGSIRRRKKDGSGGDSLITMQVTPRGVAVDATHVYWTNTDEGSVYKIPK